LQIKRKTQAAERLSPIKIGAKLLCKSKPRTPKPLVWISLPDTVTPAAYQPITKGVAFLELRLLLFTPPARAGWLLSAIGLLLASIASL
jgi:hypothetical protein